MLARKRRKLLETTGIKTTRTPKQLERHMKGVANHHRIKILMLVGKYPNLSVDEITQRIDGHFKTISMHTLKLAQSGLMDKSYEGLTVRHRLSPYGKRIYDFLRLF